MPPSQESAEIQSEPRHSITSQSRTPAQENVAVQLSDPFPKVNDMSLVQVSVLLLSLGLALFLFAIDETIVATSVSTIGAELDIKGSLSWITTSYLLTTTIIQPITGRIADAVGVKPLVFLELWVFIVGNIIAGTSRGLLQMIVGRLISGIGGAGLLSLTGIIIAQLTHEKQRGAYMNIFNIVFILSDSIGPIAGGALANAGQWRWIFLFTAPFGPVITIFLWATLRIPPPVSRIRTFREALAKIDLIGMLLIVVSLSCLVVALNMGGQDLPWNSSVVIGCFAGAGASFLAFIVVETKAEMPVLPVELFSTWKWRNVSIMTAVRTLSFFHIFALVFYLPVFLQVISMSSVVSSALIIPFLIMAAISSTATSWLAPKWGGGYALKALFVIPLAILAGGMGLMSTLNEGSSISRIIGYSLICGVGFGSGTQMTMVIAQIGLPADYLSTVTALVGTAPTLGGVLGVAIVVINNAFRDILVRSPYLKEITSLNPNSVVDTLSRLAESGPERQAVVGAYVGAWQRGCWVLVGVAGLEAVLCLGLKAVVFDDGSREKPEAEKSHRFLCRVTIYF
ncbi:major facilitator superfamily domain-containing protein [Armillaria borealis]|uniref:Major facilitator superfamily domain-containing protein n=1 Tax=Armillaria borealis TaxID=47425 RepID=A0AA39JDW9_9AGAR|nr:major facilitator superfamily domain-containing protein [Armillaria borealis]